MEKLTPHIARQRLAELKDRIAAAAVRSGREASDVTLLAVSKTFPAEAVLTYVEAGLHDFGENYIQESREKIPEVAARAETPVRWHFIGHLQCNKAKYAAPLFGDLHSLESLELAKALDARLAALGESMRVYVQVNVAGEIQKSGLPPAEVPAFLEALAALPRLEPAGFMTMPPYDPDPEVSRPHFAALRELRDRIAPRLTGLSMGMSGDFEVAIEEGATIVRVGTALFGER